MCKQGPLWLNTCSPFGGLEFRYCGQAFKHRVPEWQTTATTLDSWVPRQTALCMCCHMPLLRDLRTSSVTALGKDSWKLVPGFLWNPFSPPFPFADFALDPFTVTNYNCEDYNFWVLWVCLVNDQTQRWSWRAPTCCPRRSGMWQKETQFQKALKIRTLILPQNQEGWGRAIPG